MEFLTGVKEEQTLSLAQLKEPERLGQTVQVQGAVHALRDMGNVAFVVLRLSLIHISEPTRH